MNDPNRPFKWLLVITMVVLSMVVLYPPNEKLKGGIDLVGGSSLLYEIDTTGLQPFEQTELSTKVMRILKDRVDPKGQLNIEWRPVGNTRLEIRMPRPPKEAIARRDAYNSALDRVDALNISRRDVEEAVNAPAEERQARLDALVRGISERKPLIEAVVAAYDEYSAAQRSVDTEVLPQASQTYEQAMSNLLATSLPISRLRDVAALSAGKPRQEQVDALRTAFPSYDAGDASAESGKLLSKVVTAYDQWAANKAELEDPSDLKRRLRGAGVLEFRILADRDPSSPEFTVDPARPDLRQPISRYSEHLQRFGPRPNPTDAFAWFPIDDPLRFLNAKTMDEFEARRNLPGMPIVEEYIGRHYVLMHNTPEYGLLRPGGSAPRWALKSAFGDRNPMTGENVVSFQLDPAGGTLFGNLTGNNKERQLCILLDGAATSHARINERITERCQISGRFTPEDVQNLVNTLEAGSLPARLKETPLHEQTVGPSLGETNRKHGLRAAAWGSIAVAVFVFFYYGIAAGGMANMALALNILFVLAVMALMQATFTLPGIAGLVLTVGMAIDANVLIFERIREERKRGIPFKKALNLGYDKALSAIVDSNITTLITCVILGFVASEEVKGFAITLGLGLMTSMFTALFCTRLAFNSLIAKGWLNDLRMKQLIGTPTINWIGLRQYFLPLSAVLTVGGLAVFLSAAFTRTEQVFDIEFLGGTSVQLDFRPDEVVTDEDVRTAITSTSPGVNSAVNWIQSAAAQLESARVEATATAYQFAVTADELSGGQIAVLVRPYMTIHDPETEKPREYLVRDGIETSGNTATFTIERGAASIENIREAVAKAVVASKEAANKLRGARVQSIAQVGEALTAMPSFEVVTVETNRPLVQESILAVLGDRLTVQQAVRHKVVTDEELTRAPYFVIESDDHYLSDVLATESAFDIRHFRGGVAIEVIVEQDSEPISVAAFEERLRRIGLQPEFEQFRTRDSAFFPLGPVAGKQDGQDAYRHFAVVAVDDVLVYSEDNAAQWAEAVATSVLNQVEAALESETSLTKVVQFAPQIATQTQNRALFAIILAFAAIGVYIWLRFGNKEFGLAVIVALVHDVLITLGAIGISQYVYNTIFGKAFLLVDFKIDLAMIAAILTVIGYSLNDTIVVFDRIRENRGRSGALTPGLINESINQTMARTILTSLTLFFTVAVLYLFGGHGVHGFAFALLIGVITGTYSTVAIAVPLVYQPKLLVRIVVAIVGLGLLGLTMLIQDTTARWIFAVIAVIAVGAFAVRMERSTSYAAQPAGA